MARSTGLPSHMGKATSELKAKVPDCVALDFNRLAHELGTDVSGLLRELILIRLYGLEQVSRMRVAELRMVAGIGPETTPNATEAA